MKKTDKESGCGSFFEPTYTKEEMEKLDAFHKRINKIEEEKGKVKRKYKEINKQLYNTKDIDKKEGDKLKEQADKLDKKRRELNQKIKDIKEGKL